MIAGVLTVVLAIGAFVAYRYTAPEPTAAPFSEFMSAANAGQVKTVEVDADTLTFERTGGGRFIAVAPQGYIATNPVFLTNLVERGIRVDVNAVRPSRAGTLSAVALGLLFFGFAGLALFRIVTGRVPTLEKARTIDTKNVTVTFKDVAGVDEAKDEVQADLTSSRCMRASAPRACASCSRRRAATSRASSSSTSSTPWAAAAAATR